MTSLHEPVNALHAAFCEAAGYDLPLLAAYERWYFNAHQLGITPEGLAMCLRERKRLNAQGNGFHRGVFLRNLIRDEEDIAIVIEEIAALKAKQRVRVVDSGKADALKATGRPAAVPETEAVRVGALPLIEALKRAAQ